MACTDLLRSVNFPLTRLCVGCPVRDELSFPVELQQRLLAEAETKRQQADRVSNGPDVILSVHLDIQQLQPEIMTPSDSFR